jgi:WD40 repeat protein
VVGVAIDPTGAYGAASSLDSMINIWSMADFTPYAAFKQTPSETWSVAWLPGTAGPRLAVAGGSSSTVRLLDVDAQRGEHGTKQEPAAPAAQRSMDIPAVRARPAAG